MYELKMEGAFSSQLGEETVKSFENTTGIPKNTEGRAPDTSATMKSTGKIRSIRLRWTCGFICATKRRPCARCF